MDAKQLLAEYHINEETGFQCRYIFSETERFPLHYHDYFEVFLVLKTDILHYINGEYQLLKEGSLVFIRPNDVHRYITQSDKKYRFINLSFNTQTANELFSYFSDGFDSDKLIMQKMPAVVILDKNDKNRLTSKFEQLNAIPWRNNLHHKYQMRVLLADIFSRYFFSYSISEDNNKPYWLEHLCAKMKLKENFELGYNQMVLLSGKTREHLSRCMKKYYNTTISEFVNDLRLNYVANMLINSNMSILDICFESGFLNVSWFYAKFKDTYGQTPMEFRKKYQKFVD